MEKATNEDVEFARQLHELEQLVKGRLTKEALIRFGNIRAANPKKAIECLVIMGQMLQKKGLEKINDEEFKQLLRQMEGPKREFRITKV